MVRVCTVWMMVLLLPAVASAVQADPNVDVVWPQDRERPVLDQADRIAEALGLNPAYVMYLDEIPRTMTWGSGFEFPGHAPGTRADVSRDPAAGMMAVRVDHPDGRVDRFDVPIEMRPTSETLAERSGRSMDTVVALEDLPVGIDFWIDDQVRVEGPPGFLDGFGTGVSGLRNLTDALGLPEWQADDLERTAPLSTWWMLPGATRVPCTCELLLLRDGHETYNAGSLRVMMTEQGQIVQYRSTPWFTAPSDGFIGEDHAVGIVRTHHSWAGTEVRPPTTVLALSRSAGVAWGVDLYMEGLEGSVMVQAVVDARSGEILHSDVSGYRPVGPSIFQVGLVAGFAFLLLLRRY